MKERYNGLLMGLVVGTFVAWLRWHEGKGFDPFLIVAAAVFAFLLRSVMDWRAKKIAKAKANDPLAS